MNKIKSLLLVLACAAASSVEAQNLNTGYFNDNYLYRHDLNPAFGNEKGYFAFPVLNLNLGLQGNIGIGDLVYKRNGKTVLFLNPAVSSAEFDKKISDNTKFLLDTKVQLLSLGFKAFKGYNTLEINVRANAGVALPGTLLKAMKDGLTNKEYDFSNLGATAHGYGEIALGHSHQLNDNLRIGAKLKVLAGVGAVDMKVNKATLNLGEDNYTVTTNAEVAINTKNLTYAHSVNENTGHAFVDTDFEDAEFGVSGTGFAVDLGAEYKTGDWDFSLAVNDIGFIKYGNTFTANTGGDHTFETNKYIFNIDADADNNFEDESDKILDDISALYELEDKGNTGSTSRGLGTTLNLGVKYTMPFYKRLSVGLTNSTRFQGKYSWTDFRLGANFRPANWFALSANLAAGTFGVGFGWMIDIQAKKGIDLYFGMDRMPGKFTKDLYPLSSSLQFSTGINIPF